MKKVVSICFMVIMMIVAVSTSAPAQDKATPQEVYQMILKAVEVLGSLGEEGLGAFNEPKGQFVWKDSYVFVIDCNKMKIVAHPLAKRIGADLSKNTDKNPDPAKRKNQTQDMCEIAANPNGGWVDYYWPKLGEEKASRKISFVLKDPKTGYLLVAGIYNDDANLDELNAQLK